MKRTTWVGVVWSLVAIAVGCAAGSEMVEELSNPEPVLGDIAIRARDGTKMVFVPAGEFEMGSTDSPLEQPVHTVLLDGFWIDRTEVSNAQYWTCVEAGVCEQPLCWYETDFSGPNQPVVCVDWYQAVAYCGWVGGRLPTEAEWEYAARGPESLRYPWGDQLDRTLLNSCDINCPKLYADEEVNDGYAYTAPVGSYAAGSSWCGALDMVGNVWEWVADWYGQYPSQPQVNPTGPDTPHPRMQRMMRGGGWDGMEFDTRAAVRKGGRRHFEMLYVGFRCASSGTPQ